MDTLRVRVYNVLFGDGILVSVPERDPDGTTVTRHLLIDVGNLPSGTGSDDTVFGPIVRDIQQELGGQPLDLYVMTHEHMDHVQGLLAASKLFNLNLTARFAWMTASAAKDYYDTHPAAGKAFRQTLAAFEQIASFMAAAPEAAHPALMAVLLNNSPSRTADCVDYLRTLAGPENTKYVFRGFDIEGNHPFEEARLELWAPEEDTSVYYGQFQPMALGVTTGAEPGVDPQVTMPTPPSGVDAGAFYDLVNSRQQGFVDNLLSIDKAKNNTSVVFSLEWRGWKLLFTGDAEIRSWKTMDKEGVLEPVDFLKVGHHGSVNATPKPDLLDKILPMPPPGGRQRRAVVSTREGAYNGVPDPDTMTTLSERCELQSVESLSPDKLFLDFFFEGQA